LLTSVKQPVGVATARCICHNVHVAENRAQKNRYIDPGWPSSDVDDDHAVSELAADRTGALSPFGALEFPQPAGDLPYLHPVTVVNK
jgi:hypothetical protein